MVSAATNVVQIKSLSALTHSDQAGLTINLNNMIIKVTFVQGSGGRSATCSTPSRANFATKLLSTVSFTNFLTINQAIDLVNIADCFISAQSTNQLVTVRGCFSLDLHTFPEGLQRTSVREYWDVSLIIMIMIVKTI